MGARRDFLADRRGGISVMAAGGIVILMTFSALAVDLGSVFLQTRRLQGAVDLAAMAAARDLDNAQAAANATAQANSWGAPLAVAVVKGRYDRSPGVAPAARFQPQSPSSEPDAAKVRLSGEANLFFGQMLVGRPTWTITRQATAARADLASFSIGTRLASLNGGIANSLLSALTGSQVSLSVMDYKALVDADVDLFAYLDAVSTELKLTGASYDQVLDAKLTTGQALSALSVVLAKTGDVRASAAVRALALSAGNSAKTSLEVLFDVGPYGRQSYVAGGRSAAVSLAAMDLTSAVLRLSSGARQVELDLGSSVPGLADVDAWLAIGEPPNNAPWMTITSSKSVIVRTSQARIYLKARVGGTGLLSAAQINVPLYLEAASGEAKLNTLDCSGRTATLDVRPGLGSLAIGEIDADKLNDFKAPLTVSTAAIAKSPVLTVTGRSEIKIGGLAWKRVTFTESEARARVIKTVATTDIANATVSSLIGGLALNVEILGLGLGPGQSAITATLGSILGLAATPLDDVLNSLTALLGVRLGEADVQMNGLRCREAALVA